jgi:hypothetical protein
MGKQYGGEGKSDYRSSSDSKLPQHGGEGKNLSKGNDMKLKGSNRPSPKGAKLTNV